MRLSRRSTLETLGALSAGTAMTGTALAVGQHEDDERDADDEQADGDLEATAAVRVAHFSTDAPNVDVYLDDEQVLSDVTFDEVSSYLELEPGTHSLSITAAGDTETVVFEDEVSFSRAFYTIAAIGDLEADAFRPLILTDAGSAIVRLGHAAADAPAVSVTGNDGRLSLYENVSFGDVSDYVALPAGQYTLEVTEAGEGADDPESGGTEPRHDEVEDEGTEDADEDDDEQALDEESDDVAHDDDADAITTFEVNLERGGAYTAYAVGAQEGTDDGDELSVTVTGDGPMAESMGDRQADTHDEATDDVDDDDGDSDSDE